MFSGCFSDCTRGKGPDYMDPMFVQALDYFDRSNGLLIHLKRGQIMLKGPNQNLNGPKIGFQIRKPNCLI